MAAASAHHRPQRSLPERRARPYRCEINGVPAHADARVLQRAEAGGGQRGVCHAGLSFARRYLLRAGRIANPARRISGRRHILPDTSDEFELLREGYFGVVAGHDHRNGFVGEHEGLLLIATPTCGFNTYGPAPAKRATRLIEFDIRHPYEPRTQLLEFGELVGKPSSKRAYTYAVNQTAPGEGEGDDLLRKPSLWSQLSGLFR